MIKSTERADVSRKDFYLEESSRGLPWKPLELHYTFLEKVHLKLSEWSITQDITFQGKVILEIEETFLNPASVHLVGLKGLKIKSNAIVNEGFLETARGSLKLKSSSLRNTGEIASSKKLVIQKPSPEEILAYGENLGKLFGKEGVFIELPAFKNEKEIRSSLGPVEIITQEDLSLSGLVIAEEEIKLLSKNGFISTEKALLITPKKIVLSSLKEGDRDVWAIKDANSIWHASKVKIKAKTPGIHLSGTHVSSGLKIVSLGMIKINDLMLEAFKNSLNIDSKGKIEIIDSKILSGATLKTEDDIRVENSKFLGKSDLLSFESSSTVGLKASQFKNFDALRIKSQTTHIWQCFFSVESLSETSVKEHIWQKVRVFIQENDFYLKGGLAEFTEVKIYSKGSQRMRLEEADFFQVEQKSLSGSIATEVSKDSAYIQSKAEAKKGNLLQKALNLKIKKTNFVAGKEFKLKAKHELRVKKSDLEGWESLYLKSFIQRLYEVDLKSYGLSRIKAQKLYSLHLLVFSKSELEVGVLEEASLVKGNFKADKKISLVSQTSYLDVSQSEFVTSAVSLEAEAQIDLPDTKWTLSGKAHLLSKSGPINAKQSRWSGVGEGEVYLQALNGSLNLDFATMDLAQKIYVLALFIHTEGSLFKNKRTIDFDARHLALKDSKFESLYENILLQGKQFLLLENVESKAIHGKINHLSEGYFDEKEGNLEADRVNRAGKKLYLEKVTESAKSLEVSAASASFKEYSTRTETMQIVSEEKLQSRDSHYASSEMVFKASSLSQENDDLQFSTLSLEAGRDLTQKNSSFEGTKSHAEVLQGDARIDNCDLKLERSEVTSDSLSFTQNKAAGFHLFQTKESQTLTGNTFRDSDLSLDSLGTLSMEGNKIEGEGLEASSRAVRLTNNQIELTSKLTLNANAVDVEKTEARTEKGISVTSVEKLSIDRSTLTSSEAVSLKGENTKISKTNLESEDLTEILGTNAELKEVHILDKVTKIDFEKASLDEITVRGERFDIKAQDLGIKDSEFTVDVISENAFHLNSLRTQTNAKHLSREAEKMTLTRGHDTAEVIIEKAKEAHKDFHTTRAYTLDETIDSLTLYQSKVCVEEGKIETKDFTMAESLLQSHDLKVLGGHLEAAESKIEGKVSFEEAKAEFLSCELRGETQVKGEEEVKLLNTKVEGSFGLEGGELIAPELEVKEGPFSAKGKHLWMPGLEADLEESLHIETEKNASLSYSNVASKDFSIKADTLQAKEIEANVKGEHQFITKGTQDLYRAKMNSENHLSYQTEGVLYHKEAESKAKATTVIAPFLDNTMGGFEGDLEVIVPDIENKGGTFDICSNSSYIETDKLTHSKDSKIKGPGSLQIVSKEPHVEESEVKIGGSYQLQAPKINIDTDLEANKLHLLATQDTITIEEGRKVDIEDEAILEGLSVKVLGTLETPGSLSIHQKIFLALKNVRGDKCLAFSSDSSITLLEPVVTKGTFKLISLGNIATYAPITAGDQFIVSGQIMNFYKKIDASGRAILQGKEAHFRRMEAFFRKGINAEVEDFISHTSDLHIIGDPDEESVINTHRFILESTTIPWGRGYTAFRYPHTPSTFTHENSNLIVNATEIARNLGSHILVRGGDLTLTGKDIDCLNSMHVHSWYEEAGTYHTRRCMGFGKKKKHTLWVRRHVWVVDGPSLFEVEHVYYINLIGNLRNNGSMIARKIVLTKVKDLFVGFFNRTVESPTSLPPNLPHIEGLPALIPGGQFQASEEIEGRVEGLFHLTGVAGARKVKLHIKKLLLEALVVQRLTQVPHYRRYGRVKVSSEITECAQPGGQLKGEKIKLTLDEPSFNRGGQIEANKYRVRGSDFTQEALELKTIHYLDPGRVSPFRKLDGFSRKTVYHKATTNVYDAKMHWGGTFKNIASEVVTHTLFLEAIGDIIQENRAAAFTHTRKKGWTKSKELQTITFAIACIVGSGRQHLKSHKNISIEGELGSYLDKLKVEAKGPIELLSKSYKVRNKYKGIRVGIGQFQAPVDTIDGEVTLRPHVFGGTKASFKSETAFLGLAPFLAVAHGNLKIKAPKTTIKVHKEHHSHHTKTFKIGLNAFGLNFLRALAEGNKGRKLTESALSEVPALHSLYKLASSKYGFERAANLVRSIIHVWNFAKDFINGASIGQLLGLENEKGEFCPRVYVEAGVSTVNRTWTVSHLPEILLPEGGLDILSDDQYLEGIQGKIKRGKLKGRNIHLEGTSDTYRERGKSGSLSVGFGGSTGIEFGFDIGDSRAKKVVHMPLHLDVEEEFEIIASRELKANGSQVEAGHLIIDTPNLSGRSTQDTFTESHFNFGLSTGGRIAIGGGRTNDKVTNHISYFRSRNLGEIRGVSSLSLLGFSIENMSLSEGAHLSHQPLYDSSRSYGAGVNLSLNSFISSSQNQRQGLTHVGDLWVHDRRQKGVTQSTFTEANGRFDINTNPSLTQNRGPIRERHYEAALVSFDLERLRKEVESVRTYFQTPPNRIPEKEEALPLETIADTTPNEEIPEFIPRPQKKPAIKKKGSERSLSQEEKEAFVQALFQQMLQEAGAFNEKEESLVEKDIRKLKELKEQNPFWIMSNEQIHERMALGKMLGAPLHVVDAVLNASLKRIAENGKRRHDRRIRGLRNLFKAFGWVDNKPLMEKTNSLAQPNIGQKTNRLGELAKALTSYCLQKMGKEEFAHRLLNSPSHQAERMEREFLIPREETEQYLEHAFSIGLVAIPIPGGAALLRFAKAPINSFKKIAASPLVKNPVKTISSVSKTVINRASLANQKITGSLLPFLREEFGGVEIGASLRKPIARALTPRDVGLEKVLTNPYVQHRASITVTENRAKVKIDWLDAPRKAFSFNSYNEHLFQLAHKHKGVKTLEIEILFSNRNFCKKWRERYKRELREYRVVGPKEFCRFEIPLIKSPKRTKQALKSKEEWKEIFRGKSYAIVDGGKGSHLKMKRANSPMVIIPANMNINIEKSLGKTLKQVEALDAKKASIEKSRLKKFIADESGAVPIRRFRKLLPGDAGLDAALFKKEPFKPQEKIYGRILPTRNSTMVVKIYRFKLQKGKVDWIQAKRHLQEMAWVNKATHVQIEFCPLTYYRAEKTYRLKARAPLNEKAETLSLVKKYRDLKLKDFGLLEENFKEVVSNHYIMNGTIGMEKRNLKIYLTNIKVPEEEKLNLFQIFQSFKLIARENGAKKIIIIFDRERRLTAEEKFVGFQLAFPRNWNKARVTWEIPLEEGSLRKVTKVNCRDLSSSAIYPKIDPQELLETGKPFLERARKVGDSLKHFFLDEGGAIALPFRRGQEFTLVQEEIKTLKNVSKTEIKPSPENYRVIAKTNTLEFQELHHHVKGAEISYVTGVRSDGAFIVFVEKLSNKNEIRLTRYYKNGLEEEAGSRTLELLVDPTLIKRLLTRIKKEAVVQGCNRILLEFPAKSLNKKPVKIGFNHFEYLGRKSENSFGLSRPKSEGVHSFEIALKENSSHESPSFFKKIVDNLMAVTQYNRLEPNSLYTSLIKSKTILLRHITDISHFGKEDISVWKGLISQNGFIGFTFIKQYEKGVVAELHYKNFIAIVKQKIFEDFISETVALEILHSLKLKHMLLPEPLGVGQFKGKYVLAKTKLEGDTLRNHFNHLASPLLSFSEQEELYLDLKKMALQAGKAMGELRQKSLKMEASSHRESFQQFANHMHREFITSQAILKGLGVHVEEDALIFLERLAKKADENPRMVSLVLSDIHGEQFVWCKEKSAFGYIDCETLVNLLDIEKRPFFYAEKDFYDFHALFIKNGMDHGISRERIDGFIESFNLGYFSECPLKLNKEYSAFFEIVKEIKVLKHIAYLLGEIKNISYARNFILEFNAKYKLPKEESRSELINIYKRLVDEAKQQKGKSSALIPLLGLERGDQGWKSDDEVFYREALLKRMNGGEE
ncbi:hypothetical protein [Criblamydia sequanensis]|uniref:Uncharacterized protein n=1 Tax=Candidatus Criblamydia sequanensis CRIB-18 TaxID=1437425 RepID=A0A090CZ82_9BACT|nr:hypothetical protein [Criblamydia sequanensis]CDR34101.1 hypothetical protein CSEC_1281 [Criblamydia sequanensis CRIB-18]